MKTYKSLFVLCLMVLSGVLFSACEDEMESMSWKPGNSLHIVGADEVKVGRKDVPYYVEGFTIKETYEWRLNNNVIQPARNGEFVYLTLPAAGAYVLTVNNGKYTGTMNVTAVP